MLRDYLKNDAQHFLLTGMALVGIFMDSSADKEQCYSIPVKTAYELPGHETVQDNAHILIAENETTVDSS